MTTKKLLTFTDYLVIGPRNEHPEADEANDETARICEQNNIALPHFAEYNTLTGYMYPRTTKDRLVTLNLWVDYLFFIDDYYDRNTDHQYKDNLDDYRRLLQTAVRVMCEGYEPDHEHVIYPAAKLIYERLSAIVPSQWLSERFQQAMLDHLNASTLTIDDIYADGDINVDQYVHYREMDSGMYPTIYLLEPAFGIYLSDEVFNHPFIKRIIQLCNRIATLSNDIFSYEKEVIRLGADFNLIKLIEDAKGVSFDEALHEVVAMINEDTQEFLLLQDDIPDFGDAAINESVEKFTLGIYDHIVGAYHWQMSTNRYRSPNSPIPELREMLPQPV